MTNVLTAATVIVPIVMALTQLLKKQLNDNKLLPVANIVIGVIIGGLWAISFADTDLVLYLWAGLVAGLAAGGFYDLGASFVKGGESE